MMHLKLHSFHIDVHGDHFIDSIRQMSNIHFIVVTWAQLVVCLICPPNAQGQRLR